MSELVKLGSHISIQKGKPPIHIPYFGKGAEIYLSPDYLRNKTVGIPAKAGGDAVRVEDGDTVLLWDGSNAGEFFKAKSGFIASTMARIAHDSNFVPAFFFHLLKHSECILKNQTNGTGIPHVDREVLEKIEVFCPVDIVQTQISEILDTLDTAIHKTEAIIEKLKQVKQGLLHDLLTRGVDANGELRPSYEQAPHLYQDSPLGWIPKEWTATQVGREADIQHGFAFAGNLFASEPVGPTLMVPGNFYREGGLYFTNQNTKYFAGKYPAHSLLSNGDVLVVMTDLSPMTLILGRTVVLNEAFPVLHNQRIGKFVFHKENDWDAYFFAELLSDNRVRLKVIAEATGTTVRHTSPDRIKSCFIARPSLNEQKSITARLLALHERLSTEQENLGKLQNQKVGLMDDLLTGRVRVTTLLKDAVP